MYYGMITEVTCNRCGTVFRTDGFIANCPKCRKDGVTPRAVFHRRVKRRKAEHNVKVIP